MKFTDVDIDLIPQPDGTFILQAGQEGFSVTEEEIKAHASGECKGRDFLLVNIGVSLDLAGIDLSDMKKVRQHIKGKKFKF
jgi:hypothetical protein